MVVFKDKLFFFCCTINVVLHDILVLEPQNVGLYTLGEGERGSVKVYCLYTHENVDIYGGPLNKLKKLSIRHSNT